MDGENLGTQMMWFGEYEGQKRFKDLPEDYVQITMNDYIEGRVDNPPDVSYC